MRPPEGEHLEIKQEVRPLAEVLAPRSPVSLESDLVFALTAALGDVARSFRVSFQGHSVVLRGNAPSYADKAHAEQWLRSAGYHEVDNRLRVVPSISSFS